MILINFLINRNIIIMIQKTSKLYVEHPNILHESSEYALPILWTQKKKKLPKQKSSQIGILLNRLTKQRMIGSIIEETRSKKYSSGKRKNNSSLATYQDMDRSTNHRKTSIEVPETYVSMFEGIEKGISKSPKLTPSPNRIRLPSISSPKFKQKQVPKLTWEKISREGRLKKDLLVSFLSKKTFAAGADTFVRFFEPPFESAFFKFNQFLAYLNKLSELSKKFFEFQMLDLDNDGIISPKDILQIYMIITSQSYSCNQQFKSEIDKLSICIKQYSELQQKPKISKNLFQTVICDRNSTVDKLSNLVDPQYKAQGALKEYVHRSAYRHTFLMFGHNGKMRARTQMIEQARNQMMKMNFKNEKGLSFGAYVELPLNFVSIFVDMFTERGEEFSLILK